MNNHYSKIQTQFMLAMLSYPTKDNTGSAEKISNQLYSKLKEQLSMVGDWLVVWGPGVFKTQGQYATEKADNVMYVAYSQDKNEYAICIAGTISTYDWMELDLKVKAKNMKTWTYGSASSNAKIAQGTWQGLQNLIGLTATGNVPESGKTLQEFLQDAISSPTTIVTNGHSLGGALSPTLALWLKDTQESWDSENNAAISTWPFAGPTIGNQTFTNYYSNRISGTHRVENTLDVVPYAWEYATIDEIPVLYEPYISRPKLLSPAALYILKQEYIGRDVYVQEGKAHRLPGKYNPNANTNPLTNPPKQCGQHDILCRFAAQAAYQHTAEYAKLLDIPNDFGSVVNHVQEQYHEHFATHLSTLQEA